MHKSLTLFLMLTTTMSCSLFCMTATFEFSKIKNPNWAEIEAVPQLKPLYDNTARHYLHKGLQTGNIKRITAALAFMTKMQQPEEPTYIVLSCMNSLALKTGTLANGSEVMEFLLQKTQPDAQVINNIVRYALFECNTELLEVLLKNGVDATKEIPQAEDTCAVFKELNQHYYEGSLRVLNLLKFYQQKQ